MEPAGAARDEARSAVAPPGPAVLHRVLVVVITGSVMSVLDMTIVNVALRKLSETFGAPLETVQWTATAYTLALAAVVPTAAWTMHRVGARRAYLTALVLFTLGSVLAACAWDAPSLIVFRAVQGLGGGLLMPVGMAMVLRSADRARLGRAMALFGLPVLVGPAAGPVLGGWLLDTVSWRWIFLVNLPVGAVALALAAALLPVEPRWRRADGAGTPGTPGAPAPSGPGVPHGPAPSSAPDAPGARLDVPGLLMLSPGLALLLFGLARGGERGDFGAPGAWGPAVAGAVLVAGFTVRALRARAPLLDLRLLRDRTFAVGTGTLALFTCGYFGSMLLAPVYWQQARGMSATAAGLLGVPMGLTVGVTMQIAARRIDTVSPRRLIVAGVAVGTVGMALTGLQTGTADVAVWRVVGSTVLMSVGCGMVLMPTTTTATRALPVERTAAASTALGINSQVWVSVGTALMSVVLGSAGTDPAGFRITYLVAAGLLALAVIPAAMLPGRKGAAPAPLP